MLPILNYITWDVSPFIYESEHFAIGWYGTLWTLGLIGMLVTLLVTVLIYKTCESLIPNSIIDFATFVWQKIDFYHFPLQKFVYVKKKQ